MTDNPHGHVSQAVAFNCNPSGRPCEFASQTVKPSMPCSRGKGFQGLIRVLRQAVQMYYCSSTPPYSSSGLAILFPKTFHIDSLICLCLNVSLHFVTLEQFLPSPHTILANYSCQKNKS